MRRVPVHIQGKVGAKIRVQFNKNTSEYPIVRTTKKDGTVMLTMDAKHLIDQIHKNEYHISNLLELLDSAALIIASTLWRSVVPVVGPQIRLQPSYIE